jgi:TolA-binding protein
MNLDLHTDEILDSLFHGKISRTEAVRKLELEEVGDTSECISMHEAAIKAIQRHQIQLQLSAVHQEYKSRITEHPAQKAKVLPLRLPWKWVLRAAVAVILMVSVWFVYQYTSVSSEKLYSELYQPYYPNTSRGEVPASHNMVGEFRNKNYKGVIGIFEGIASPSNREYFLAACAYLETGNYRASVNGFEKILSHNKQSGSRLYNDEAEFYIGLSHLRLKESAAARNYFEKIYEDKNHTFHDRVTKKVMKQLRWLR